MGQLQCICKCRRRDEVCMDMQSIKHGKVYQLWSFMSATDDQYMWITNDSDGNGNTNSYKVRATGKAEGDTLPLLQITFIAAGDDLFYMQFQKNNETYEVQASEDKGVNAAVKGNSDGDPTKWLPIRMHPPNEPFYAFKSDQGSEPLYLSSDGKGNMQLKRANTTYFPPPEYNPYIDPALLFRAIEPPI